MRLFQDRASRDRALYQAIDKLQVSNSRSAPESRYSCSIARSQRDGDFSCRFYGPDPTFPGDTHSSCNCPRRPHERSMVCAGLARRALVPSISAVLNSDGLRPCDRRYGSKEQHKNEHAVASFFAHVANLLSAGDLSPHVSPWPWSARCAACASLANRSQPRQKPGGHASRQSGPRRFAGTASAARRTENKDLCAHAGEQNRRPPAGGEPGGA